MYPFWLNSRLMECSVVPGLTCGSPTAIALTRSRRVHVSLQQQRRRFERRRDVVEPELRAVGRQQIGHVNVDCQQIADRVRIFGAIQTMHDVAARRAVAFPGAIERCSKPARKARVLGLATDAACLEAASPARSVSEGLAPTYPAWPNRSSKPAASRLTGASAGIRRAFVVTRDAVLIHERAVLGRIRGWPGLGAGAPRGRRVRTAERTRSEADQRRCDYDLPACSSIFIARLLLPLHFGGSSFPCRRSSSCHPSCPAAGSGGG